MGYLVPYVFSYWLNVEAETNGIGFSYRKKKMNRRGKKRRKKSSSITAKNSI